MTGTRYYPQTMAAADLEQQARYTRVRVIFIIIDCRQADDTPAIVVEIMRSAVFLVERDRFLSLRMGGMPCNFLFSRSLCYLEPGEHRRGLYPFSPNFCDGALFRDGCDAVC